MESSTLKMPLIDETYKAFLVSKDGEDVWIPRSLVRYLKKLPHEKDGSRFIEFELPEWKIEQEGLEDYVIG